MEEQTKFPKCKQCEQEVVGYTMIAEEVFSREGTETIKNSVILSCGCSSDFARYNVDPEEGFVEIEDMITEEVLIEWEDPRIKFPLDQENPWD